MVTLAVSLFLCLFLKMGSSDTSRNKILEPVKLSNYTPEPPSPSKMVELLQTGYRAVNFTSFRSNYSPDTENIYYFVSRSDLDIAYPVILGDDRLLSLTGFDPARRTVVLVHGWLGSVYAQVCLTLVKAYLQVEDVNIIIVDWNAGAHAGYLNAVANTMSSGESAARFLNWLIDVTGTKPCTWHFIGHSLGGHLAGIIGRHVRGVVGYISALDPAMPLWMRNNYRLRSSDSAYTEVIHTNAGLAGHPLPLGHVDIYPNGGVTQPGCDGQQCDHDRCVYLMAESLLRDSFECIQCPSYLQAMMGSCKLSGRIRMGGNYPKTGSTGVYYVQTRASSPF